MLCFCPEPVSVIAPRGRSKDFTVGEARLGQTLRYIVILIMTNVPGKYITLNCSRKYPGLPVVFNLLSFLESISYSAQIILD